MLIIIKDLLNFRASKTTTRQRPEAPPDFVIGHHRAELEMIRNGQREHPIDPYGMVPVPEEAQYRDGHYVGVPLNSIEIERDDIIPFLEVHRDQSLWLSAVRKLNYDLDVTFICEWMLTQSDCDGLVAATVFDLFEGPYFCGVDASNESERNLPQFRSLAIIEERERAGHHYKVQLSDTFRSRAGLTIEALIAAADTRRSALAPDVKPLLETPEVTLRSAGQGELRVREFMVEECSIVALSKAQAATFS